MDERKRLSNRREHRIDFADLEPMFESLLGDKADLRRDYGQARRIAVGWAGGIIMSVVNTWGGEARWIISARRAKRHEACCPSWVQPPGREDFYRHTVGRLTKDRTDWERLREMTGEEIEGATKSDPDNPPTHREFW